MLEGTFLVILTSNYKWTCPMNYDGEKVFNSAYSIKIVSEAEIRKSYYKATKIENNQLTKQNS